MEPLPSQLASASLANIPSSQPTTAHNAIINDPFSDQNLGHRIGIWTGIGAVILILMSISGWFFYRRGKKKRAKLGQRNADDQEQGHMNSTANNSTSTMLAGGFLTGGKPELRGESADPARVRTELPGDIERPLLSSANQANGGAHGIQVADRTERGKPSQGQLREIPATADRGATVVAELDGNSRAAVNLVELPGSLPPLRETQTETGQVVITSGEAERTGTMLERNTGNPLSQPSCSEHDL